jgi:proline iminopeptidase
LVADLEKLREHLKIDKWVVFGGSWGSTLSLIYAETHPTRVKALILRGIFNIRRRELVWCYQSGASAIHPDAWEKFIEPIPEVERHDLMSAYHRRLTGNDDAVRQHCAKAWSTWEMVTSRLIHDPELLKRAENDTWSLQFASIEW